MIKVLVIIPDSMFINDLDKVKVCDRRSLPGMHGLKSDGEEMA